MSAILIPGGPTPSVLLPTAMIVAAWVSCCRFSVKVSPFALVTVSESGTGPRLTRPVVVAQLAAAGFISAPIPSRMTDGARNMSARAAIAALRNTAAPQRRGLSSWDSRSKWQVWYVGAQTTKTVNETGCSEVTGCPFQMPERWRVPSIVTAIVPGAI